MGFGVSAELPKKQKGKETCGSEAWVSSASGEGGDMYGLGGKRRGVLLRRSLESDFYLVQGYWLGLNDIIQLVG